MKKIYILLVLFYTVSGLTFGQNVPNNGFEEWEQVPNGTMEPVSWQTNNLDDMTFVYQEYGHSGNSSAKINVVWDETLNMNITPMLYYGGFFPVSERYTALNLYLMGESLNDDYLMIGISMYSNGMNIGSTIYPLYDDYGDWTLVSVPITYGNDEIPDQCSISFTFWPADAVDVGSYFFIDDLELGTGSGPVTPILVGAFTNMAGTAFELIFNTPMADPAGTQNQFSGTHNGSSVTFISASLKPGSDATIVLDLASPVQANEVLRVSYSAGTVESNQGVPLESFTDEEVTNLVGETSGSWHIIPSGTGENLYSVHFGSNTHGYIGGGWGTFLKSTNGGLNWSLLDIPAQYDLLTVWATSANDVHAGSWDSVYNSQNGGQSWSGVYLNTVNYWVMDLQFHSASLGYMFLQASGFKKTTDGGSSWTELTGSGVIDDFHDGYMIDQMNGHAVGTTGIIAKTTDGGQTWPQYEYNNWTEWSPITIEGVHFTSLSTGFAVADSGVLFRTSDGGEHWTKSYLGGPDDHLMDIFFLNANLGWIVGYHGKIYTTIDGGYSWDLQTPVTTNDLNSVYFVTQNLGWAVGNNGTILRFGDTSSSIGEEDNTDVYGMEIYPNPLKSLTTLKFTLQGTACVNIAVYDMQGRQVKQIFSGTLENGEHTIEMNLQGLENGVYICALNQAGGVACERLIIHR